MLKQFKGGTPGTFGEYFTENWDGTGYNVVVVAPTFPNPPNPPNQWGRGVGSLTVDYQNTSTVFWGMMNKYKPIAVMTTSRNKPDNDWVLEIGAKNLARADWALLPFNNGRRPFIGGGASDPASAASLPNAGLTPNPNNTNPPDATRNADPTTNDEMGRKLTDDAKAIQQLIMDQLNSTFAPAALFAKRDTEFQGVGFDNYVSGFAGYHALWYNAWSNSSKAGWHTHVGSNITVANASAAIKLQLEVLIEWLIDN